MSGHFQASGVRVAIIGGGAAGLVAASGAAMFGVSVCLIDRRDQLGGDCLLHGCIPSKALLHIAREIHSARRASRFGLPVLHGPAEWSLVRAHIEDTIAAVAPHDDPERFRQLGVDVRIGSTARLLRDGRIAVGEHSIKADKILIATGARPVIPTIEGLSPDEFFTSETLWSGMPTLPKRLVIIGGGAIGCEMAQAFVRLGSRVTLVEQSNHLLPQEESEAGKLLEQCLRHEGVDIRLGARPETVRRTEGEKILAISGSDGERAALPYDTLLLATGRTPQHTDLGLDEAGVECDSRGFIVVNEGMRTSNPRIYAAGDAVGAPMFTHVAEAQARVALQNMLFPVRARFNPTLSPSVVFTSPEVASVGAREATLIASQQEYRVFYSDLKDNDRAITEEATAGFVRVLSTPEGRILGATLVGEHAGELIHEFSLAISRGLKLSHLSQLIRAYPTMSGANRRVGDAYMRTKLDSRAGQWLKRLAQFRW
jgi:pyruvate/2-oxoglutarate dehydrogenase complex dihydrolipoamide dehydrogenase (E3) component